jgi:hypothetical protein
MKVTEKKGNILVAVTTITGTRYYAVRTGGATASFGVEFRCEKCGQPIVSGN